MSDSFWESPDNQALAQPCYFSSLLPVGERKIKIFNPDAGTLEFWIKPDWNGRWFYHRTNYCLQNDERRYFVNMGPVEWVKSNFKQILTSSYNNGTLSFELGKETNVKWKIGRNIKNNKGWIAGTWHHLAFVWDANAQRNRWLRMYVDGKEFVWAGKIPKEERLKGKPQINLKSKAPYSVQIGARNNGLNFAGALIDEMRISRIARYNGDFTPPKQELKLDKDTSALFHFNNKLDGEGMEPDEKKYNVPATAGIIAW